jgi:hypothetical protein
VNTTYYLESETTAPGATNNVGAVNHSGSSLFNGSTINSHLIFDALNTFVLQSVKVYTDTPGERRIELRNSSGSVLQSVLVNIPSGESRVSLNFNVPAGTNLQLGTNSSTNTSSFGFISPQLRRSSSGVSFPYLIDEVVRIHDTPYGTSYYYYFYDWEVRQPDQVCTTTPRIPVQAFVDNSPGCTGTCSTPGSTAEGTITPTSAQISWTSGGSDVMGYQVSGRKFGSTTFRSTNVAGLNYTVTNLRPSTIYEWKVRSRCNDGSWTSWTPLSLFGTPASRDLDALSESMSLSPNPSQGSFLVHLENVKGEGLLSVENLLGQTLHQQFVAPGAQQSVAVNAALEPGLYLVRLHADGSDRVQRLVVSR